jgi:hypothetical protein
MGCDAAGGKPSGGNANNLGFMIKNQAAMPRFWAS